MNRDLLSVLSKVAELLNSANVLWGVGASMLLSRYSLAKNPSDIDITASVSDMDKIDEIMMSIGTKRPQRDSGVYLTERFEEYIVDGIDIDVMAGLTIKLKDNTLFEYAFDPKSVPHRFTINNVDIPFASLEEWYVLYQLMPDKEQKAILIDDYFKKNGIQYPYLLDRMRNNTDLPSGIKSSIDKLLDK